MVTSYIVLTISFIFLATIVCWVLVTSATISRKWKLLLIPLLIWYGAILFYAPAGIMGWPKDEEPPDKALIVATHIVEPSSKGEGGIYFWVVNVQKKDEKLFTVNPKKFVEEYFIKTPKSYKIKYDRMLHEELLKALKEQKDEKGLLFYSRNRKSGDLEGLKQGRSTNRIDSERRFRIIVPELELPSKN